jgi:TIR domain
MRVFICFSQSDHSFVESITQQLRQHDVIVVTSQDTPDLLPSIQQLQDFDAFILIVSESSFDTLQHRHLTAKYIGLQRHAPQKIFLPIFLEESCYQKASPTLRSFQSVVHRHSSVLSIIQQALYLLGVIDNITIQESGPLADVALTTDLPTEIMPSTPLPNDSSTALMDRIRQLRNRSPIFQAGKNRSLYIIIIGIVMLLLPSVILFSVFSQKPQSSIATGINLRPTISDTSTDATQTPEPSIDMTTATSSPTIASSVTPLPDVVATSTHVPTATRTPMTTSGVKVTGVLVSGANSYFGEEDVTINNTSPITAMVITITIQKTSGTTYGGEYTTFDSGLVSYTHIDNGSTITFKYILNAGKSIQPKSNWWVAAQILGNGRTHDYTADTYSALITSNGITNTITGAF